MKKDRNIVYLRPKETLTIATEDAENISVGQSLVLEVYLRKNLIYVRNFFTGCYHKFHKEEAINLGAGRTGAKRLESILNNRKIVKLEDWNPITINKKNDT